jgi:hypothetical protein
LAEVLEAGEREYALATTLRDDAGESGEGRDVGEFVERQQQSRALGVTVVGGMYEFFDESDHEGNGDGLVPTRRNDVELVRTP